MSTHKFTRPIFSSNDIYAPVECVYCGEEAKQYKYGNMICYKGADGTWTKIPTKCLHFEKLNQKPEAKEEPVNTSGAYQFSQARPGNDMRHEPKQTPPERKPEIIEDYQEEPIVQQEEQVELPPVIEAALEEKQEITPYMEEQARRHKFIRVEMPEDKISVFEYCACGAKSIRYRSGSRVNVDDSGILAKAGSCPLGEITRTVTKNTRGPKPKAVITPVEQKPLEEGATGRHKFIRVEPEEGAKFVMESCLCGIISKRWISGGRDFYDGEGKATKITPKCTVAHTIPKVKKEKKVKVIFSREIKREAIGMKDLGTVNIQSPTVEEIVKASQHIPLHTTMIGEQAESRFAPRRKLEECEARLVDAYVIIKVLYEDAVKAGINTTGRNMAGRLLYSAGFEEFKKMVESRGTVIG